jgi:hypothetical protein
VLVRKDRLLWWMVVVIVILVIEGCPRCEPIRSYRHRVLLLFGAAKPNHAIEGSWLDFFVLCSRDLVEIVRLTDIDPWFPLGRLTT